MEREPYDTVMDFECLKRIKALRQGWSLQEIEQDSRYVLQNNGLPQFSKPFLEFYLPLLDNKQASFAILASVPTRKADPNDPQYC